MLKRIVSGIMLTLLLISMLTLAFNIQPVKADLTELYVDPAIMYASPSESFTVDLKVASVERLHGWQVNFSWNPTVLSFINVTEGDFLRKEGQETMGLKDLDGVEEGWALFSWGILGKYYVSGSGVLATVELEVLTTGESMLDIVTEPVKGHVMTFLLKMKPGPVPPGEKECEEISFVATDGFFSSIVSPPVAQAAINIDPDTLNLKSKGRWITAYIELPEGYSAGDVDISTVMLNGEMPAELRPAEIGDYDEDAIPDLMVKFKRASVIDLLSVGEATLTITGEVNSIPFEGSNTIRVIN